jgi:pseudaminic acid cytidylyltransferase
MSNICIIPARGGSKRIPRKNIKEFLGKPIIAYSIEAAIKSGIFDEVMVSTDDKEIAEIAVKYGAKTPFFRSDENSDDYSGTGDVVFEVLKKYNELGFKFRFVCCIYATAPLISENKILEGFNLILNNSSDVVFPVAKFSSPIWRSYSVGKNNRLSMNFPENDFKRSQDLPDAYFDAGQFYWVSVNQFNLLENKNTFGLNKSSIILDDSEVQDIDNVNDWEIAEIKFELLKNCRNA